MLLAFSFSFPDCGGLSAQLWCLISGLGQYCGSWSGSQLEAIRTETGATVGGGWRGGLGFITKAVCVRHWFMTDMLQIWLSWLSVAISHGRSLRMLSMLFFTQGSREQFENYYRNQRRKQARLVLQPHSNMHETLEGYRRYFNQIVFVVEDHILHTTQGLVNRAYVEELWELALSKTIAALRTHSSYCTDPDLVLDLKNLIVLLADTLQGFGFPVSQLFDMMFEMREQYGEILLKKWNLAFRQVLDQDNFSPIPVATEEEYRQFTSQFPFQDPELDKLPFPKKLPFSEFVPQIYSQLKEFVYACLKYYEDLHLSSTEIDDVIRKSTNLLLTRTLSNCLQYAMKKKNVGLAELVQVIINTTQLEASCVYLEEFISNITNVPPDTANATKLYGTSTFKDARHAAEEEIYTNLNAKIDQFLQLADYDWTAAQGGGAPSDYLSDLIAFLCSTFSVFTHLPGKVAQTACMSACKHLSTSLLQLLLETDVRQVSMGALQQFNTDVKECERFARAGPVPGFQGDTLLLAFSDLRQVSLCLSLLYHSLSFLLASLLLHLSLYI
uniref:Exocyst complex component 6B n=1 Tax=Oncorhynchus kisutch TaxID=8019 RepID=A0A8C7DG55_ONCKI